MTKKYCSLSELRGARRLCPCTPAYTTVLTFYPQCTSATSVTATPPLLGSTFWLIARLLISPPMIQTLPAISMPLRVCRVKGRRVSGVPTHPPPVRHRWVNKIQQASCPSCGPRSHAHPTRRPVYKNPHCEMTLPSSMFFIACKLSQSTEGKSCLLFLSCASLTTSIVHVILRPQRCSLDFQTSRKGSGMEISMCWSSTVGTE